MLERGRLEPNFWEPLRRRFYERYEQLYGKGSSYRNARLEVVTLRLRATAETPRPKLRVSKKLSSVVKGLAKKGKRKIYWSEKKKLLDTPIFDGAHLVPGNRVNGPAVVETTDTTVAVPPGCRLRVDRWGNFEITY
jgi:N-methylhydantoinase A